jgi:hypothetical protein
MANVFKLECPITFNKMSWDCGDDWQDGCWQYEFLNGHVNTYLECELGEAHIAFEMRGEEPYLKLCGAYKESIEISFPLREIGESYLSGAENDKERLAMALRKLADDVESGFFD